MLLVIKLCSSAGGYKRFERTLSRIFRVEDGGGKFCQMFVTTYEIRWPNHGIINVNVIKKFIKFDIHNAVPG